MQSEGMSRKNGKKIGGNVHLEQSIRDILTTRIGTRVMLRDYGSDLPALIDKPMNASLVTNFIAATAGALRKWEPRVKVEYVKPDFSGFARGQVSLTMRARYLPDGYEIRLDNIVLEFTL
jgi:phage baseplate assembly protein W